MTPNERIAKMMGWKCEHCAGRGDRKSFLGGRTVCGFCSGTGIPDAIHRDDLVMNIVKKWSKEKYRKISLIQFSTDGGWKYIGLAQDTHTGNASEVCAKDSTESLVSAIAKWEENYG